MKANSILSKIISLRFIALGTVMYTIATQRYQKSMRHLNHPKVIP